jgi:outer membrane protein assembly factor BamB
VYTVDKDSKLPNYGYRLLFTPSAAPVADDVTIYFSMDNRVAGYDLPDYSLVDKVQATKDTKKKEELEKMLELEEEARVRHGVHIDLEQSLMPDFMWSYLDPSLSFPTPPLLTGSYVGAVTNGGMFFSFNKFDTPVVVHGDYRFTGNVPAAMGQHGDMAYIGSDDYTLYALHIGNLRLYWRYLSGAPIHRTPAVTDRDVFVAPERRGLVRVDRDSGRERWRHRSGEQFLAVNQKYVYATDRFGKLLVLDYARGSELGHYDMSDYVLPLTNDLTDRIYFANHDGQILCLRQRDNVLPYRAKTLEKKKPEVKPPVKKEEKVPPPEPEPKVGGRPGDRRWQLAAGRLNYPPGADRRALVAYWEPRRSGRACLDVQSAICNPQSANAPCTRVP